VLFHQTLTKKIIKDEIMNKKWNEEKLNKIKICIISISTGKRNYFRLTFLKLAMLNFFINSIISFLNLKINIKGKIN